MDLHDYLAQMLVLSKLKLAQTRQVGGMPSRCNNLLKEAEEALGEALTYTRTLVADLSPPILQEFGLSAALKWLGERMERHQLAVTVDIVTDLQALPEHQSMLLFQSVRELLLNVAKHAKSKAATVRLETVDTFMRLEVRDEGIGFDPTGGSTIALSSKFGLFSIRERMKALGGTFELESAPGKGTTATLVLPVNIVGGSDIGRLRTAHPEPLATQPKPSHSALNPDMAGQCSLKDGLIRVLLVDDHAMVRQGLRSVLDGYADMEVVGEVGDGSEAVALVSTLKPSVVVMDINMPKMNGIEATAHIKHQFPDIIVIGLSVNTGGENQEAMKKAGAAALLTKEAAVEQLNRAIREALFDQPNRIYKALTKIATS